MYSDCDSMVYDGFSYSWVLMNMGNPTAIGELLIEILINDSIEFMIYLVEKLFTIMSWSRCISEIIRKYITIK